MTNQTFIKSFPYIRIIACFSIILLHSLFASSLYFKDAMSSGDFLFEQISEHMLMWGVPLFLMITGVLLLNPEKEVSKNKLIHYIKRPVIALVAFTFIFQIFEYLMEGETQIIKPAVVNIFTGQGWAHMWYLYLLISIYLMLPIYRSITKNASRNTIRYIVILLVVFTSILPMLKLFGIDLSAFNIPIQTVYPAYIFIGYYLYHNRLSNNTSVVMLAASSALIVVLTVLCSGPSPAINCISQYDIASYSSILTVIQASSIFSLLLNIKADAPSIVESFDKCSFGIYLIHMIGIRAIMKWWAINPYEYSWMSFLIIGILLFLVSYAITYILKKIPKLDLL